jgi:hypothetical protein
MLSVSMKTWKPMWAPANNSGHQGARGFGLSPSLFSIFAANKKVTAFSRLADKHS